MSEEMNKIKELIGHYGDEKGYLKKSQLSLFCEDNGLNYIQWHTYTKGKQKIGLKIIQDLMNIFPNLNLNWFLKDENNMFIGEEKGSVVSEPAPKYGKNITNLDIYKKLIEIENEVVKNASNKRTE